MAPRFFARLDQCALSLRRTLRAHVGVYLCFAKGFFGAGAQRRAIAVRRAAIAVTKSSGCSPSLRSPPMTALASICPHTVMWLRSLTSSFSSASGWLASAPDTALFGPEQFVRGVRVGHASLRRQCPGGVAPARDRTAAVRTRSAFGPSMAALCVGGLRLMPRQRDWAMWNGFAMTLNHSLAFCAAAVWPRHLERSVDRWLLDAAGAFDAVRFARLCVFCGLALHGASASPCSSRSTNAPTQRRGNRCMSTGMLLFRSGVFGDRDGGARLVVSGG